LGWWNRAGDERREPSTGAGGESVYERRWPPLDGDDDAWTPLWDVDPQTGRVTPVSPDWRQQTTGWRPIGEVLRWRL
jgi:hypothetical protein